MSKASKNDHNSWPSALVWLYEMAKEEVDSWAGRVNIFILILLAFVIVAYLFASTIPAVARIVASAWNPAFLDQSNDNILMLLMVLLGAAVLCLLFMRFTIKEKGKK